MSKLKEDMRRVQAITHEAYIATGGVLALLDGESIDSRRLADALDKTAERMEAGTVELRNLCERHRPRVADTLAKPMARTAEIGGRVTVTEMDWLHIELDALLPNCNRQTPKYLTDTITRLLNQYERTRGPLPHFKRAILVIDEHCDITSRQVYDQDNKAWKAIPNALKGRVLNDDDQFTMGICLLSTQADKPRCHIYLLPLAEVDDFFWMRCAGHPML